MTLFLLREFDDNQIFHRISLGLGVNWVFNKVRHRADVSSPGFRRFLIKSNSGRDPGAAISPAWILSTKSFVHLESNHPIIPDTERSGSRARKVSPFHKHLASSFVEYYWHIMDITNRERSQVLI